MEYTVLTRQELFDLVWWVPMRTLAQRYGISDVALGKRCKKHGIPKPGLGYWARVAAGQKPRRPTLPKASSPRLERIVLKPAGVVARVSLGAEPPVIEVPEKLVQPHEATLWARQALKEGRNDAYGRLEVGGRYHPDLCVRPQTVARALLIMDTIVKALVQRGVEATASNSRLSLQSGGERLVLQVEERLTKQPHLPTAAELKAAAQPWGRKPQKWDYVPDGRLCFRLSKTHYLFRGQSHWTESKKTPLEQQLGRVVVGIEAAVAVQREAWAEEARQQAQRLADERARLRPERLEWYQRWMAEDLEAHATRWAQARQLREFLAAYEAAKKPTGAALEWLAAARGYTDALDPLVNGDPVARELEPADQVLEQLIAEERERQSRSR